SEGVGRIRVTGAKWTLFRYQTPRAAAVVIADVDDRNGGPWMEVHELASDGRDGVFARNFSQLYHYEGDNPAIALETRDSYDGGAIAWDPTHQHIVQLVMPRPVGQTPEPRLEIRDITGKRLASERVPIASWHKGWLGEPRIALEGNVVWMWAGGFI